MKEHFHTIRTKTNEKKKQKPQVLKKGETHSLLQLCKYKEYLSVREQHFCTI